MCACVRTICTPTATHRHTNKGLYIHVHMHAYTSGADPGFRRGGGVRTFRRGGFVQEFQERIQIVAGSWANQQVKKIADSRGGGGGGVEHPKKPPVSAHARIHTYVRMCRPIHRHSLSTHPRKLGSKPTINIALRF